MKEHYEMVKIWHVELEEQKACSIGTSDVMARLWAAQAFQN
jgi:hypothetical protein